jgi:hypothetical protein
MRGVGRGDQGPGAISSCGFMPQIVGLVCTHGNRPLSVTDQALSPKQTRVLAPFLDFRHTHREEVALWGGVTSEHAN